MKKILIPIVLLAIVGLVYFLKAKAPATENPSQTQMEITNKGPLGVAKVGSEMFLVDTSGHTLYFNKNDEGQKTIKSSCDATCEKTWLPYLFNPNLMQSQSQDPVLSRLNSFLRADGQRQYALGTKPLYRFSGDKEPGDHYGADGVWTVARP